MISLKYYFARRKTWHTAQLKVFSLRVGAGISVATTGVYWHIDYSTRIISRKNQFRYAANRKKMPAVECDRHAMMKNTAIFFQFTSNWYNQCADTHTHNMWWHTMATAYWQQGQDQPSPTWNHSCHTVASIGI